MATSSRGQAETKHVGLGRQHKAPLNGNQLLLQREFANASGESALKATLCTEVSGEPAHRSAAGVAREKRGPQGLEFHENPFFRL